MDFVVTGVQDRPRLLFLNADTISFALIEHESLLPSDTLPLVSQVHVTPKSFFNAIMFVGVAWICTFTTRP